MDQKPHNRRKGSRKYFELFLFIVFLASCESTTTPDTDADNIRSDADIDSSADAEDSDTRVHDGDEITDSTPVDGDISVCERLETDILAWIANHQECSDDRPCQRIGLPELPDNLPAFCDRFGAPGEDLPELKTLTSEWDVEGCGEAESLCGGLPGRYVCVEGRCILESPDCEVCDFSDFDPQCTTEGWNAINSCLAEHCLLQEIAHSGWCEDSPECVEVGGYCEETTADLPYCPDGYFYSFSETTGASRSCAPGQVRNTCCISWDETCTYYAGKWQAETNPFTCEESRVCMDIGSPESCNSTATISSHPLVDPFDATLTVTLLPKNRVSVEGTSAEFSRTFTCSGPISHEFSFPTTWTCNNCNLSGEDCRSCDILTGGSCSL